MASDAPIKLTTPKDLPNEVKWAFTMAKLQKLYIKMPTTLAEIILHKAQVEELSLFLLSAPERFLPSC